MEACNGTAAPPHFVLLASPGMGHLIPLAALAERLVSRHGAMATLITFASPSAPQRALLASLPPSISSRGLPPADLPRDLPRGAGAEMFMLGACERARPELARVLAELKRATPRRRQVVFVADLFTVGAFDAARDAGVERRWLFLPVSLHTVSVMLRVPGLAAAMPTDTEVRDLAEPLQLPGCVPIPGSDVFQPLDDRSNPAHPLMVRIAERYREADVILTNSFHAVEPEVTKVLGRPEPGRPPVYSIGPLIRSEAATPPASLRAACLQWLDRQPAKSVIFVSFGSGGTISGHEMRELALGLELSGQRFLWVVRSPIDDLATANDKFFNNTESKEDPSDYLPDRFVERTKDVGLLVPSWAPQAQVLAHEAIGGFLTHCGWNSTLESLVHGVPLVAWPLYAEQRLNALMLAEGVGAVIRLPEAKEKETISSVVRELMVGEGKGAAVRAKVVELQKAAIEGLGKAGAATTALDEVVEKWVN